MVTCRRWPAITRTVLSKSSFHFRPEERPMRIPRIVADWLSRKWSQPVVIENRTGAAGNIGAEQVYHSAPDGYTLLSSAPPPLVINHNLYPKLGFDPTKFEPVIVMAHVPNALMVNPNNIKASSVPELIEYLKAIPTEPSAPRKATARPRT
jgi:tripartite-type tricarboxylate transporter receptor subunit TctC